MNTILFAIATILILSMPATAGAQSQTKADTIAAVQDTTQKAESLKLLLDQMEIQGWVDKPQMVYVVPGVNPEVDDIVLERSFIDEILRPLNKDEFERRNKSKRKSHILW